MIVDTHAMYGERIKRERKLLGLTQEELANEVNKMFGLKINKGMVSKWENQKDDPSLVNTRYLSQFFNVTTSYLLGDTEIRNGTKETTDSTCNSNMESIVAPFIELINMSEMRIIQGKNNIVKEHMSGLLTRYKKLLERYCHAQLKWDKDKGSFEKYYKEKENPLTDEQIKELYLSYELKKYIDETTDWLNALPSMKD